MAAHSPDNEGEQNTQNKKEIESLEKRELPERRSCGAFEQGRGRVLVGSRGGVKTTSMVAKKSGKKRVLRITKSPHQPESEVIFMLTEGGIGDVEK